MSGGSSLAFFLLASLAVIGLTYGVSRLLGTWQAGTVKGRRMRVLEGTPLGKDRSLLLVAVGKEVLVVGVSPAGVSLVHQVTDPETLAGGANTANPNPTNPNPTNPNPTNPLASLTAAETSIQGSLERMRALVARTRGQTENG